MRTIMYFLIYIYTYIICVLVWCGMVFGVIFYGNYPALLHSEWGKILSRTFFIINQIHLYLKQTIFDYKQFIYLKILFQKYSKIMYI